MKESKEKLEAPTKELLCPIRYLMNILSGKWKMPILCMLSTEESLRYNIIKRRLGDITNVMLSQSLKDLGSYGMVHREQYNEVPPRVEYSLTEKGKSILPALGQLAGWAVTQIQNETNMDLACPTCQTTL